MAGIVAIQDAIWEGDALQGRDRKGAGVPPARSLMVAALKDAANFAFGADCGGGIAMNPPETGWAIVTAFGGGR